MKKQSRLRKNVEGYSYPAGILFRDFDKKIVDKDKIEDITYGPSISREFDFMEPKDNSEWSMRSNFTKTL